MKKSIFLLFLLTLAINSEIIAQNEILDIRIAERLKPSEADNLYGEYNNQASFFNSNREEYRKKARKEILGSVGLGLTTGVLSYFSAEEPEDALWYGATGFTIGFYISIVSFNDRKFYKRRAKNYYYGALRALPK
jgi:hypothetical protein